MDDSNPLNNLADTYLTVPPKRAVIGALVAALLVGGAVAGVATLLQDKDTQRVAASSLPDGASATAELPEDGTLRISFEGTEIGRLRPAGYALESIRVDVDGGGELWLADVARTDGSVADAAPTNATGGYVNVDRGGGATIDSVVFRFTVTASALEAAGLDPGAVQLYRYHDGEWRALETALDERREGAYTYRAVSPGLSVFAVAGRPASTQTPTPTATPTPTPTGDGPADTAAPTRTPTPAPSATPESTATPTPSATPTAAPPAGNAPPAGGGGGGGAPPAGGGGGPSGGGPAPPSGGGGGPSAGGGSSPPTATPTATRTPTPTGTPAPGFEVNLSADAADPDPIRTDDGDVDVVAGAVNGSVEWSDDQATRAVVTVEFGDGASSHELRSAAVDLDNGTTLSLVDALADDRLLYATGDRADAFSVATDGETVTYDRTVTVTVTLYDGDEQLATATATDGVTITVTNRQAGSEGDGESNPGAA